ncbi:MAG: type IV pilin protein [Steroidobacteraceae bacterium]
MMYTRKYMKYRSTHGFSLIELMIVVAVVAILATIATANYRSYMLRTNRTEGRIALMQIQSAQERYYVQNNQYATAMATVIAPAASGGLGVTSLTAGGVTLNGYYTISFVAATANTYTVQAVATGAQAIDKPVVCRIFTVDDQGARTPADSTGCWK